MISGENLASSTMIIHRQAHADLAELTGPLHPYPHLITDDRVISRGCSRSCGRLASRLIEQLEWAAFGNSIDI